MGLLPFYIMLRSIPNKTAGVFFLCLVLYSFYYFRPLSKIAFYVFIGNFLILIQLGTKYVESPYIESGQISTVLYFLHFIFIIPLINHLENSLMNLEKVN